MNLLDMVKGQMTDSVMQQLGTASGLGAGGQFHRFTNAIEFTHFACIKPHI